METFIFIILGFFLIVLFVLSLLPTRTRADDNNIWLLMWLFAIAPFALSIYFDAFGTISSASPLLRFIVYSLAIAVLIRAFIVAHSPRLSENDNPKQKSQAP